MTERMGFKPAIANEDLRKRAAEAGLDMRPETPLQAYERGRAERQPEIDRLTALVEDWKLVAASAELYHETNAALTNPTTQDKAGRG